MSHLSDFQQQVDDYVQTLKTPYWHPLSQFTRLIEETGELARLLNHLYGDKQKKPTEGTQELEEELGDILFTLICLANNESIDLDQALRKAILKMQTRDGDRFKKK